MMDFPSLINNFYRWLSRRVQSRWRKETTKLRSSQLEVVPAYYAARSEWRNHEKARHKAAAKIGVTYLVLFLVFLAFLVWAVE